MKLLTRFSITCAALVALSGLASAQFGREEERYRPNAVSALVDRVHGDLDRGYRVWHLSHDDQDRLTHAEHQLRDFANRWNRGKFDKDKLDDSISAVQHVINNNHLAGRERDELWGDVEQLRQMREAYDRHEIGYRR